MQPLGAGPDEKMRYMVAQYLHEHPGKLPLGDEPTIRDATWGISYAYYPILSYMVSAVFMGIAGLFHASADGLLHAARMADVLFVTGAVYFVVKASGKLFPKEGRWLFAALAGFMPQALFLGTYVNTDSLALLSCIPGPVIWKRETGASEIRSFWLLEWQSVHCPTIMPTDGSYAAFCFFA